MPDDKGPGLKGWLSGPRSKDAKAEAVQAAIHLDKNRLAVLPLANVSPDAHDEYFADGLTEELITTLSRLRGLQVIARTSIMPYKGATKRVTEIGRELEVGSLLEGSVRKAGNRIRVTAQLIDVSTESHLWSEKYDRELDDVFRIQDDIAGKIADALRLKFATTREPGQKPTENIEAYTLYLKGRSLWNKRTRDGILESLKLFLEAIKLDPEYSKAWSGLADAYIIASNNDYLDKNEAWSKAKEAALKALALDDGLAEAHVSLGEMLHDDLEFDKAQKEFLKAIILNPNYATAHHWYSNCLSDLGRINESIDEIKKARELDPLSPIIAVTLGRRLFHLGKIDEAIAAYDQIIAKEPGFALAYALRCIAFMWKRMKDRALADLEAWHKLLRNENIHRIFRASFYAWFEEREKAQEMMSEQLQNTEKSKVWAWAIAVYYAILGEADKFFAWIDKAIVTKNLDVESLRYSNFYDKVRKDPRFPEIFRKLEIPY